MADEYLGQLSQLTGIPHFPNHPVFGDKKGSLIGARDGYLLAIGPGTVENNKSAIKIMIRFRTLEDVAQLKTPLEEAKGDLSSVEVGNDFALGIWSYSFRKPKMEAVAEAVNRLLDAVKQVATGFEGRCEICRNFSVNEITLMNGIPGYHCSGCQEKIRYEAEAASGEYERREASLPQGVLYGSIAALAGSVAWGGVAYLLNRIFLWGAIGIGWVVGKAFYSGMGKVNLVGQVLVGVLTVASVLFGDVIFYTLSVMKAMNVPFSFELLQAVMADFWEIETSGDSSGWASIAFALIGAGYVIYTGRKPQFHVKFEPLGGAGSPGP